MHLSFKKLQWRYCNILLLLSWLHRYVQLKPLNNTCLQNPHSYSLCSRQIDRYEHNKTTSREQAGALSSSIKADPFKKNKTPSYQVWDLLRLQSIVFSAGALWVVLSQWAELHAAGALYRCGPIELVRVRGGLLWPQRGNRAGWAGWGRRWWWWWCSQLGGADTDGTVPSDSAG